VVVVVFHALHGAGWAFADRDGERWVAAAGRRGWETDGTGSARRMWMLSVTAGSQTFERRFRFRFKLKKRGKVRKSCAKAARAQSWRRWDFLGKPEAPGLVNDGVGRRWTAW